MKLTLFIHFSIVRKGTDLLQMIIGFEGSVRKYSIESAGEVHKKSTHLTLQCGRNEQLSLNTSFNLLFFFIKQISLLYCSPLSLYYVTSLAFASILLLHVIRDDHRTPTEEGTQ